MNGFTHDDDRERGRGERERMCMCVSERTQRCRTRMRLISKDINHGVLAGGATGRRGQRAIGGRGLSYPESLPRGIDGLKMDGGGGVGGQKTHGAGWFHGILVMWFCRRCSRGEEGEGSDEERG